MGFRIRKVGVEDTETGEHIVPGNPRWPEYEAWLAQPGNAPLPAHAEPAITRAETLARKLGEIEDIAGRMRRQIAGAVSPHEMASWAVKREQALAFAASAPSTDYELLTIEADARGVPVIDIASRIIAKANAYSAGEAQIAGVAGRHKDAVRELTETGDILAYDATVGWP